MVLGVKKIILTYFHKIYACFKKSIKQLWFIHQPTNLSVPSYNLFDNFFFRFWSTFFGFQFQSTMVAEWAKALPQIRGEAHQRSQVQIPLRVVWWKKFWLKMKYGPALTSMDCSIIRVNSPTLENKMSKLVGRALNLSLSFPPYASKVKIWKIFDPVYI